MSDENSEVEATKIDAIEIRPPDLDETGANIRPGLLDLVIGGILEGNRILQEWLGPEERRHPGETDQVGNKEDESQQRIKQAALGFTIKSTRTARKNLRTASRISEKASSAILSPVKRIFNSRPLRPVRDRIDTLAARGEQEIEDWIQMGADQERRSREIAQKTLDLAVEDVVRYLSNSPALKRLIESQIDQIAIDLPQTTQVDVLVRVLANNYINYLYENPSQVQELIKGQGDTYLAHLEENPEQVQSLVQGQSVGLIEDIREEVRTFTVTGDSFLELLARRLFRRPNRTEPPEPPPEVQMRAPYARLEGDFPARIRKDHE